MKMTASWYCLHSKPHKEEFLFDQLVLREIEAFYPQVRVKPINPRARKIKPYFPGYVFARVDLEQCNPSSLHWIPGTAGLVSFGGEPACVPDPLIQAIRRRVDEINAGGGQAQNGLRAGDIVTIQADPFRGYKAIFDARLSGNERVRVLLRVLDNRQVPLELSAGDIQPKTLT